MYVEEGKVPVIEIFGPTIQGEGNMIGRQTMFLRTGACDYKCYHCDSMHAVDKHQIKLHATYMTPKEIVNGIKKADNTKMCPWVTISGGNPALWDMSDIVKELHTGGYKVAVETQGTYWKDWLLDCDLVTISPKGPSMWKTINWGMLDVFNEKLMRPKAEGGVSLPDICLKVVLFGNDDVRFAEQVKTRYPETHLWLSLGNSWEPIFDPETGEQDGYPTDRLRADLAERYDKLATQLSTNKLLKESTFLPQLHVLIWGNEGCR